MAILAMTNPNGGAAANNTTAQEDDLTARMLFDSYRYQRLW